MSERARRIAFAVGIVAVALALLIAAATIAARRNRTAGDRPLETPTSVLEPGDHSRRVTSDGRERDYLLHIPLSVAKEKPKPLVLMFHPGLATGTWFANLTDMSAAADRAGYVVAYPEGFRRTWNAGDCCGPAHRVGVDDVRFSRDLITDIERLTPIDPDRVYAAGYSNGGGLSYRLACELSDRIAGVAAVSAAMRLPFDQCRPSRPVSALQLHGLRDPVAPYGGGAGAGIEGGNKQAIPATIANWARLDRCAAEPLNAVIRGSARSTTYQSCNDGTAVVLVTITDMGHQWPGAASPPDPAALGPPADDVDASTMILTFFSAHPRH